MAIEHDDILHLMKVAGYDINSPGVCNGLANMANQAIVVGELEQFLDRLDRLQEHMSVVEHVLKNPDAKAQAVSKYRLNQLFVECQALFDGIALHQEPIAFEQVLGEMVYQPQPDALPRITEITKNSALEDSGGLVNIFDHSGIYTSQEVEKYFDAMSKRLSGTKNVAIKIYGSDHSITINFDRDHWHLIDINKLSIAREPLNAKELAANIVDSLFHGEHMEYDASNEELESYRGRNERDWIGDPPFASSSHPNESPQDNRQTQERDEPPPVGPKTVSFSTQVFVTINNLKSQKKDLPALLVELLDEPFHQINKERTTMLDSQSGNNLLYIAARENKRNIVKKIILAGGDMNETTRDIPSPLHMAADYNYRDLAKDLLDSGALPDAKGYGGNSALHVACREGNGDIAFQLIMAMARHDIENDYGDLPLHLAVKNGHEDLVPMLALAGASINAPNKQGMSALHLAVLQQSPQLMHALLYADADVNATNNSQQTPLWLACQQGDVAMVDLLLESRATQVDLADQDGYTPLMVACQAGHTVIIERLMRAGANVNMKTHEEGHTPLTLACVNNQHQVVNALREHSQLKINERTNDGSTALLNACQFADLRVVETLLSAGADLHMPSNSGETPILYAYDSEDMHLISLLHRYKANIHQTMEDGTTALMLVCQNDNFRLAIELLSRNIDIHAQDDEGMTALMYAASHASAGLVEYLLTSGADVNERISVGTNALMLAAGRGDVDVVAALLAVRECEIDRVDIYGNSALSEACQEGNARVMDLLLDNGATVDVRNPGGLTPLMVAILHGHNEIVDELLHSDADPNCHIGGVMDNFLPPLLYQIVNTNLITLEGMDPFMLAVARGDMPMVEQLIKAGADLEHVNSRNQSALYVTVVNVDVDMMSRLMQAGMRLSTQEMKMLEDNRNFDREYYEKMAVHLDRLIQLKKASTLMRRRGTRGGGVIRTLSDDYNITMLLEGAIHNQDFDVASDLILEHRLSPNITLPMLEMQLIDYACQKGAVELVMALKARGLRPPEAPPTGKSTMMYALSCEDEQSRESIVGLLLGSGFELGKREMDYAEKNLSKQAVESLFDLADQINAIINKPRPA